MNSEQLLHLKVAGVEYLGPVELRQGLQQHLSIQVVPPAKIGPPKYVSNPKPHLQFGGGPN